MAKIQMDNPDRLKVTLARYHRINFKYKDELYSLQCDGECFEPITSLRIFKDSKWEYINSIDEHISNLGIVKTIKNKSFKGNVVYSHINKSHFLKSLHECGFIDAGYNIELRILCEEFRYNEIKMEMISEKYNKELNYFRNLNDLIKKRIDIILIKNQLEEDALSLK